MPGERGVAASIRFTQQRRVIASLIETCKLNAVDPHAYLVETLTAIVNGHKQSDIDALLPWNYNGVR